MLCHVKLAQISFRNFNDTPITAYQEIIIITTKLVTIATGKPSKSTLYLNFVLKRLCLENDLGDVQFLLLESGEQEKMKISTNSEGES